MSNNIYNILGKLKGITDNATSAPDTEATTVYESVDARGSITEAVKSLEEKYQTFKESAKPDFLDLDKDGDKKEPMKKAAKDKNNAKGAFKDMFGGDAKDLTSKLKIKEGAGPYTLDDPKHPKFKANYEKFKKSNPDCKLADFVAAMKKKEKGLNEGEEITDLDAYQFADPDKDTAVAPASAKQAAAEKRRRLQDIEDRKAEKDDWFSGNDKEPNVRIHHAKYQDEPELDEVAPPGANAERMVKHIKKGYAKDGKLSKKEKGIAYATAWKAKKAGVVEATEFKDTIANSKAELKKAKLAVVKESRVMEETDYFYEKVAKALCGKNPNLDTAGSEFADAVRKEMVAQGIEPNRARNILLMDEDFLMDVASSYGHYCKELAECGAPINSHLGGSMQELDEIAALAGISAPTSEQAKGIEQSDDLIDEGSLPTELDEAASRKDFRMVANLLKNIPDDSKRAELAQHHADIFKQQNPRFNRDMFLSASGVSLEDELLPDPPAEINVDMDSLPESDMSEGNEFSGALAAAKASGAKEFEVDGKRYTVKEDINVNITANGQEDALNLFRKLAGMEEVAQPVAQVVELPQDAESAIAQGMVEPIEVEVDEERDIEYANTPNEKIGPVDAAIPSGNDLHKSKKSYSDKPYRGDNPMAVAEAADGNLWKKYSSMLKGLIK